MDPMFMPRRHGGNMGQQSEYWKLNYAVDD
jgi:hypothetical protein